MSDNAYDLVVVGTSFSSSFFLLEYLKHAPKDARVLVVERGKKRSNRQNLEENRQSDIPSHSLYTTNNESKYWTTHVSFGGNSNCWWGCTPRFLPNDFRLKSLYGVGTDWPISYDELEPYYAQVEEVMQISGDSPLSLFPRSTPFPQPPHRQTSPERMLRAAHGSDMVFPLPTARARIATKKRPACCANARCDLCPIDAKFRIQNEMSELYDDPRITLQLECEAFKLETTAGMVTGILLRRNNREVLVRADLFALGANALVNPTILLRSGFAHKWLGAGINQQVSLTATVLLNGLEGFDGSTSITSHGYMLYDGEHRRSQSGCLIEFWNRPDLRPTLNKWRQVLQAKMIFEDLPLTSNRLVMQGSEIPRVEFAGSSAYMLDAAAQAETLISKALKGLPIEKVSITRKFNPTEDHICGTTRMGLDPEESVVDKNLRMHTNSNVLVLGSGAFPTSTPANPTLTLSALSLRAGRELWA